MSECQCGDTPLLPRGNKKEFIKACREFFSKLPQAPDGKVLSIDGAVKACNIAVVAYLKEVFRYQQSEMSSASNGELSAASDAVNEVVLLVEKLNNAIVVAENNLNSINENAKKRLQHLPSHLFRLIIERSESEDDIFNRDPQKLIATIGEKNLSGLDISYIHSRVGRFAFRGKAIRVLPLVSEDKILNIKSLVDVLRACSKLCGLGIPLGGNKSEYQEFKLHPTYLLIRECRSILHASKIKFGSSKGGQLFRLGSLLREYADGTSPGMQRAIEKLALRSDQLGISLDTWTKYRSACLLRDDLSIIERPDEAAITALEEHAQRAERLKALIQRQAKVKLGANQQYRLEFGPLIPLDDASPFG